MVKYRSKTRKYSLDWKHKVRQILPCLLIFFILHLCLIRVDAAQPNQKPESWQINGIIAGLQDEYPRVQYLAAEKLREYHIDEPQSEIKDYRKIINKFAKQLESKTNNASQLKPKDNPRLVSIYVLGVMKAKEFAPQVAQLLKDTNSRVRNAAARALREMEVKEFTPQVAQLLKKTNLRVQKGEVKTLGEMEAKEIPLQFVQLLKDSDWRVRYSAARVLGEMKAKEFAPKVAQLLKDNNSRVQNAAARALKEMKAKEFEPQIAQLLKDSEWGALHKLFLDNRSTAARTVAKLGKQDLPDILQILDFISTYNTNYDLRSIGQLRFLAHFVGGGNQDVKILMQWLGKPKTQPQNLTYQQGKKVMELFEQAWKVDKELPDLRIELAAQIAEVAREVSWKPQDIGLLTKHYNNLKNSYGIEANAVNSVILNLEGWKWVFATRNIIITHIIFWLALIFAYPKSPQVQAMFFWNPWVRRILGMGYVGFLLTWVPFLRRNLFEPFKPSLLADAGLSNFDVRGYFPESMVRVPVGTSFRFQQPSTQQRNRMGLKLSSSDIQPITQAIPSIKGQIVLIGDSGLGKSMFLCHLVKISQKIVVYLPAHKCEQGVIEAIQAKLHGHVQDTSFLKSLIYSGALDICIDGLNQVSADTRSQIKQFVESYFRGNIIMATQPLEWEPPKTANIYHLQPLTPQQIETFLLSRQNYLARDAKITGTNYQQTCKDYLKQSLNPEQPREELAAVRRVLSNPMDLTLVALMLSGGDRPDLLRLQQQQYNLMATEFIQEWGHEFPLKKFSQAVYQMRLNDESALPVSEFYQELESMEDEKYKMVVSRQWKENDGETKQEWYFRHDKIMDFFLVQNFLGESDEKEARLIDHIGDPRFRGVYFLLATLLPSYAALELREKLIQYAADTKDHTVSDRFVQLLRRR